MLAYYLLKETNADIFGDKYEWWLVIIKDKDYAISNMEDTFLAYLNVCCVLMLNNKYGEMWVNSKWSKLSQWGLNELLFVRL